MAGVMQVSLLSGPVPVVLIGLGLVGLLVLVVGRDRRWCSRGLPVAVAVAATATAVLVVLLNQVWRPFPDAVPPGAVAWMGAAALALVLPVSRGVSGRRSRSPGDRRSRRWAGVGIGVAGVSLFVAAAAGTNLYFGQYPTVGTALGVPLANQVDLTQLDAGGPGTAAGPGLPLDEVWAAPSGLPTTGSVAQASIPGTRSGFVGQSSWVYLPPAYLSRPRATLPVLVLLSGQPGSSRDWFDGGRLAERMDRYAAAHHGLAPVVVVPDHLGAPLSNPLCMDSRLGQVGTYLDVDVPAWIRQHLHVDPDPRAWAIGGLSEGGTCALQSALRSPTIYPTFLDISGQDEPTLGSRDATVSATFGGDTAAFVAVNPLDQLAARRYPDTAARVVVGSQDGQYRPQTLRVRDALVAAGVAVDYGEVPGGHDWQVWGPGLEQSLPWLGTRLGLTR